MNHRQITDLLLRLDRLLYDHAAGDIDPVGATVRLDHLEAYWHGQGWPVPVPIDVARTHLEANDPEGFRTLETFRTQLEARQRAMRELADQRGAERAAAVVYDPERS